MEQVTFNDYGNTALVSVGSVSASLDQGAAQTLFCDLAEKLDANELEAMFVTIGDETVYMDYADWRSLYISVDQFMDKFCTAALEEFGVVLH